MKVKDLKKIPNKLTKKQLDILKYGELIDYDSKQVNYYLRNHYKRRGNNEIQNDQFKFLLLSHGFIFNNNINNNNITRGLNDKKNKCTKK